METTYKHIIMAYLSRWLYSTNHKDIGTLYFIFSIFAGMLGTAFSMLIRLELSSPGATLLVNGSTVAHVLGGTLAFAIIFFVIISGIFGDRGNIQIRLLLSVLLLIAVYWLGFNGQPEIGPGVQGDNQLYNVIVTAHALVMIFFLVNSLFLFFNLTDLSSKYSNISKLSNPEGGGAKVNLN